MYPILIEFLLVAGWALVGMLGFKLYKLIKIKKKKIVNRVAVDCNGECYCPICFQHMLIILTPNRHWETIFSCVQCKVNHSPWLENGTYINASEFYAFQQENPQEQYTSEIFEMKKNEYLKNQGLIKSKN